MGATRRQVSQPGTIDDGTPPMTAAGRIRVAFLVAALGSATAASAANLGFLKDAPIARFTEQDLTLFKQTLDEVLDKGADGEARRWSNPETKAGGEIKAIKSFERGATPCRRVAISNAAKGLSASGQYNFCKQPTGQWAQAN